MHDIFLVLHLMGQISSNDDLYNLLDLYIPRHPDAFYAHRILSKRLTNLKTDSLDKPSSFKLQFYWFIARSSPDASLPCAAREKQVLQTISTQVDLGNGDTRRGYRAGAPP